MEFNDGSQYRIVTNAAKYKSERPMYEFRATSRSRDRAFDVHRSLFKGFPSLMYHFPYLDAGSPEKQADFFLSVVGKPLDNDMYMLDTEAMGRLNDYADFTRRWFKRVEDATGKQCWLYVPKSLSGRLSRSLTGTRIVKAPRYSGSAKRGAAPNWAHDVHQYTDRGYFPGCPQSGDTNYTTWSVGALLDRCNGGRLKSEDGTKIILLGG